MRIAVVGCGHGELDAIYKTVKRSEGETGQKVDMVLICGDFQAIRNTADLTHLAVPLKYRRLGDFHKYYSRQAEAPYLTLFIGGNHESSAFMWELYHGGWVAPNIYYMGHANVIRVGNLRIGGMSGIWNGRDYAREHFEAAPFNQSSIRSIYHVRQFEVAQMTLYKDPVDVFTSHDWPRHISAYGNAKELLRKKSFFESDMMSGRLGSPAMQHLLHHLRPTYWFSGHLHVKFSALVPHTQPPAAIAPDLVRFRHTPQHTNFDRCVVDPKQALDEVLADDADHIAESAAAKHDDSPAYQHARVTRFLALDKCLPRRKFIHFVDLPHRTGGPLAYDRTWLAVVRATHKHLAATRGAPIPPTDMPALADAVEREREWIDATFPDDTDVLIPTDVAPTAPMHLPGAGRLAGPLMDLALRPHLNPQTARFAAWLGVANCINADGVTIEDYVRLQGDLAQSAMAGTPAPEEPTQRQMSEDGFMVGGEEEGDYYAAGEEECPCEGNGDDDQDDGRQGVCLADEAARKIDAETKEDPCDGTAAAAAASGD